MDFLNKITLIYALCFFDFPPNGAKEINRFPDDFLFGFSTASYQIEGAWNADGKGESIWDRFVHTKASRIVNRANGDTACDSYHKYEEDVEMLKDVGAQVYRFSLSWPRILPKGDISEISIPGLQFYDDLISKLVNNNIQPMVTLFHWDLPQCLQDLGGWPNPLLIGYFEDYAKLAFQAFGDRVKWWITFNEPLEMCGSGYGGDDGAPALNMSGIADYLCAHTVLKAHARTYHTYKNEFQAVQKGKIGISLNGGWYEPASAEDAEAAETAMEFKIGWFLHPLLGFEGNYPKIMRERVDYNSREESRSRSRLPEFINSWSSYLKRSLDFIGLNHYTSYYARRAKTSFPVPSYQNDMKVTLFQNKTWPSSCLPWLKIEPTGFRKILNWIKSYTDNFPVFITENGYADKGELKDFRRIYYHKLYLKELLKAIYEDKCEVLGYIAWSIMDNFEWLAGYSAKFGIYHVDFKSPNRTRTAKTSVEFFKKLISSRNLVFGKNLNVFKTDPSVEPVGKPG